MTNITASELDALFEGLESSCDGGEVLVLETESFLLTADEVEILGERIDQLDNPSIVVECAWEWGC